MRIEGLSKDELISNLKIFKDTGASVSSPERACFVGDGLLLLGGGFRVLDQPPGGGNFATGSFPDSNVSWRARSKNHEIPSPSPITVFAIGINPTLRRADGSVFGDVVTTYHSFDLVPGGSPVASMVRPLPGFALCGGGAVTHYWYGMLIWALEPTTKPDPITELDQSFTGRSVFGTNKNDNSSITAYAMGIKFIPTTGPRPGEQCDIPIPVTDTTSDVTLNPVGTACK